MKLFFKILFFIWISFTSCKKEGQQNRSGATIKNNQIQYASGLAITKHDGFSIITVSNPWPDATEKFTYVLKEKQVNLPDSLKSNPIIEVPLQNIVVTSTTTIPFLEILEVEKKLIAFPQTDYISSSKTRKRIAAGFVKNIGQNESLNLEQLLDLAPDLIVTFGINNQNQVLNQLKKNGLKVMIQADWMEQSPLGKAEWIKLYGVLFGKEKQAEIYFNKLVKRYQNAQKLAQSAHTKPSVLYGSMYQDRWFLAKGNSWAAQFIKDAHASYLWANEKGTGATGLPFEKVVEKAKNAQFWITTGAYSSTSLLLQSNSNYGIFDAIKTKSVYTFESKIGATGGVVFYELSPSNPDLVLKDYIKIFHPELLPNYKLTFAKKLD